MILLLKCINKCRTLVEIIITWLRDNYYVNNARRVIFYIIFYCLLDFGEMQLQLNFCPQPFFEGYIYPLQKRILANTVCRSLDKDNARIISLHVHVRCEIFFHLRTLWSRKIEREERMGGRGEEERETNNLLRPSFWKKYSDNSKLKLGKRLKQRKSNTLNNTGSE